MSLESLTDNGIMLPAVWPRVHTLEPGGSPGRTPRPEQLHCQQPGTAVRGIPARPPTCEGEGNEAVRLKPGRLRGGFNMPFNGLAPAVVEIYAPCHCIC